MTIDIFKTSKDLIAHLQSDDGMYIPSYTISILCQGKLVSLMCKNTELQSNGEVCKYSEITVSHGSCKEIGNAGGFPIYWDATERIQNFIRENGSFRPDGGGCGFIGYFDNAVKEMAFMEIITTIWDSELVTI